ncbi:(2Fe-2S) ferredoxin domain-containing protein [Peribacillus cavernae]|uniref:(2Fe-2S) ferredoxin domain-containing protein n=1 Tax=Peribacillus cavernae TaxID=1674310 RepID=A0A3S0W1B9_9BACI|nr:(2Fe-2S) ferredoxin domain-containing protein [Peribacillus cavernae]MDQ0216924.1 (2Fe-2S) ferredoxin [Peribacillus cavernae]RUQ30582.1 (2Fe-2S) ferredoxin domain-containing protein [Peribacillus cavernae]
MTTWNLEGMNSHLLICNGSSCMRKGGEEVTQAIRDEISLLGLDQKIHTTRTRCNGRCKDACVAIVYPQGTWYRVDSPDFGREIVRNINGEGLLPHMIYQFMDGEMTPNAAFPAQTGISKNKPVKEMSK